MNKADEAKVIDQAIAVAEQMSAHVPIDRWHSVVAIMFNFLSEDVAPGDYAHFLAKIHQMTAPESPG